MNDEKKLDASEIIQKVQEMVDHPTKTTEEKLEEIAKLVQNPKGWWNSFVHDCLVEKETDLCKAKCPICQDACDASGYKLACCGRLMHRPCAANWQTHELPCPFCRVQR